MLFALCQRGRMTVLVEIEMALRLKMIILAAVPTERTVYLKLTEIR